MEPDISNKTPVIGVIPTSRNAETGELEVSSGFRQLIEEQGAEVRSINHEKLRLYELLGEVIQIDGMLFSGGGDIDPSYYGQEKLPECNEPDRKRDDIEMNLFPLLMTRGLPILGVCRGCQVINAAFGGTLVQDLPSQKGVMHRLVDENRVWHTHGSRIVAGTRLMSILNTPTLAINSSHHQAVDEVAPGFRIAALAEDGTIEAVESTAPGLFIIGVQWHPEVMPDAPSSKALFKAFVDKARFSGQCQHAEHDN